MTRLNGAEWKAFYRDKGYWPDDGTILHDDVLIHLDGKASEVMMSDPDSIADSAILEIETGDVVTKSLERLISLEGYFKNWRKEKTTAFFGVECDKSQVEAVRSAIEAAGGKITS